MTSFDRPGAAACVTAETCATVRASRIREVRTNPHGVLREFLDD